MFSGQNILTLVTEAWCLAQCQAQNQHVIKLLRQEEKTVNSHELCQSRYNTGRNRSEDRLSIRGQCLCYVHGWTIFFQGLLVLSAKFLEGGRKKNLMRETSISLVVKSSNYGLLNGLK